MARKLAETVREMPKLDWTQREWVRAGRRNGDAVATRIVAVCEIKLIEYSGLLHLFDQGDVLTFPINRVQELS